MSLRFVPIAVCGIGLIVGPYAWADSSHGDSKEQRMRQVLASDRVRLEQDIPELELHRGDAGVVVSSWFCPNTAYEVEFEPREPSAKVRVLLLQEQLERE